MAAGKILFPRTWYGSMISANLEIIWEMSDKTVRLEMTRATVILLSALCSCCMILSHDSYFSPSSPAEHELRSPLPGNPWNTFPLFGSPPDIITVELQGVRLGLSVRNSATSFAWLGPVFFPLIPIPVRETLQTSQLLIWFAVLPQSDVDVLLNRLCLRPQGNAECILPTGIHRFSLSKFDTDSIHEPQHVAGGDVAPWYLEFALPGSAGPDDFVLQISGIATAEGPLAPTVVQFSNVRGWRVLSLP